MHCCKVISRSFCLVTRATSNAGSQRLSSSLLHFSSSGMAHKASISITCKCHASKVSSPGGGGSFPDNMQSFCRMQILGAAGGCPPSASAHERLCPTGSSPFCREGADAGAPSRLGPGSPAPSPESNQGAVPCSSKVTPQASQLVTSNTLGIWEAFKGVTSSHRATWQSPFSLGHTLHTQHTLKVWEYPQSMSCIASTVRS